MMKQSVWFGMILLLAGCATVEKGAYHPRSSREKKAFDAADRTVMPADVRQDFHALEATKIAWAGVIKEIQFKETERTIQVAFQVDHRRFDWKDHGGGKPYQVSEKGDGEFVAGWVVQKPARIGKLKTLAKPGYMILVYGKPYQMKAGVIQLSATAVRPIKVGDYEVLKSMDLEKETDD